MGTRFLFAFAALCLAVSAPAQKSSAPPYLDPSLTPQVRAHDLVSRLTLAEKAMPEIH